MESKGWGGQKSLVRSDNEEENIVVTNWGASIFL